MLSIGVHVITTDYNRRTVLVHHLLDNVTGKPLPICGADIELKNDGDATDLVEAFQRGDDPVSKDDSEQITEEEKSKKRLVRWKHKQSQLQLIEQHKQTIIRKLDRCPKCLSALNAEEARGYETFYAVCSGCDLEWMFVVSPKADGTFTAWANDASEKFEGTAKGHVEFQEIVWKWR
jgi:hypothetical protein